MLHEQPRIAAFGREDYVPSTPALHERFLKLYDEPRIVLDLRGIDLIGIQFLAELAHMRVYRHGKGLQLGRLVIDSQYVRKALTAVGFERNWPIYSTLEEALRSFEDPKQPYA